MNPIYRTKLATAGLLSVLLGASLLTTGCGKTGKKSVQTTVSTPIVKQLSEPSLAYLSDTTVADQRSSEAWMVIANKNYEEKRYARALRAANEALSIDNEKVDARQIAMLSAVKVMGSNIDAYSDDAMMNSGDKATFNETLTNITTLINASN
ncbi:hypothetical protein [Psychrobacter sp. FME5]|uniref:hypothetical protein n=1 Tax=unclassified Psychrobacter TaxID=196806 RepID=UPI001787ED01|nr:hypothetical protein [Psychrobacter sp. FME5]MBE0444798.1 hypothetical protein [Psychrobacter sp. FME5]MDN5801861.1 hypothetical protein [Psychrobacter sp.]